MISLGCVTDADCGIHGKCNHDSHTCSCSDVSSEGQCQDSGKGAFLQHVLIFLKKHVTCDMLSGVTLNMFAINTLLIHKRTNQVMLFPPPDNTETLFKLS